MENSPILFSSIKRTSDYVFLKEKGFRSHLNRWVLINYKYNDLGLFRFGVTVNKKVGNAVTRNKIKRWVRYYFSKATFDQNLVGIEMNLIFKQMEDDFYKTVPYVEFKTIMDQFFSKARKSS